MPEGAFIGRVTELNGKSFDPHIQTDVQPVLSQLETAKYAVKSIEKKERTRVSLPPLTTSTLQQQSATRFGYTSKATMRLAQQLYEEGFITYHRTDSVNLSKEAVSSVRELISKEFGTNYLPQSQAFFKKQSKMAQEAHEAIRPTNVKELMQTVSDSPEEQKLYGLIWKRFVACQMADAVFDETTIEVDARGAELEKRFYLLRASGQIMKFEGWRKLFPQKTNEDGVVLLPAVNKNDNLDLVKVISDQKFTQPPPRYNEASIIKTLEKLGIGRPSTYAPTISTIQARGYIEKNEGKFSPTSVGIAVNDFLIKNFTDVFEYSFTAKMEDNLDRVAAGKLEWHAEIGNFWKPFVKQILSVDKTAERVKIATEKVGRACPECKEGELVIRQGRFGKFISCARFPECKYTEKIVFKIDMKCPKCEQGDVVMKKTKKGRSFFGCSRYPECDFASWKKPTADTVATETPKMVEAEE
jgi:DNA topoisomerase-1